MRDDPAQVASSDTQPNRARSASKWRLQASKFQPTGQNADTNRVGCSQAVPTLPSNLNAGRQHVADPRLLLSALQGTSRAAPDLTHLSEFLLPRMPRRPLASSSLKTSTALSGPSPLDVAVTETWFSFNTSDWTVAIGADCDHPDAEERVDEFMCYLRMVDSKAPKPLIVSDPYTKRAHVTWILEQEVYTGRQTTDGAARSAGVLRFLAAVRRGICAALKADPNFTNRLTKNPFALGKASLVAGSPPAAPSVWESYAEGDGNRPTRRFLSDPGDCRTVSLRALWHALKLWRDDTGLSIPRPRWTRAVDEDKIEKGSRLFNASRSLVYDLETKDLAVIERVVDEAAAGLRSPATLGERTKIARSIWRFMCKKFTGRRVCSNGKILKRRGTMGLEKTLDLRERQALGGGFAAKLNAKNNDTRINDAVASLRAADRKITQAAVAKTAKVCKRTVEKRWPSIKNVAERCSSGRVLPELGKHSIPAPERGRCLTLSTRVADCKQDSPKVVPEMLVLDPADHCPPSAVANDTEPPLNGLEALKEPSRRAGGSFKKTGLVGKRAVNDNALPERRANPNNVGGSK